MEIAFWILLGFVLCYIVIKAVELNKKTEDSTPQSGNNTGGTGAGNNIGEVPKNNIK